MFLNVVFSNLNRVSKNFRVELLFCIFNILLFLTTLLKFTLTVHIKNMKYIIAKIYQLKVYRCIHYFTIVVFNFIYFLIF